MATTTADERSGWGFWRILGLFVLIVLAVLVALYFYSPTELKRVGNDAMDHARSYKRTIVSDYDRFYQCMRGGGATTVAAVEQVDRPSARPRSPEAGPIVVYPPYPEYPAYPAYPDMPAGGGQDMPAGPSGQGMPPGADMGGMPPHAAAPGMQTYPGYPRAPDYPQPPTGPQGPSGAMYPGPAGAMYPGPAGAMYPGPAGTMEPGPQGAMPSPGRFQGPGGYDMPPPGMQQRWPGMPGMRMPGPPGGRTWQAQPAPPSLLLLRTGAVLTVCWPLTASGYDLETATSLEPTESWTTITSGIVQTASGFSYTVSDMTALPGQFFRLKQR